MRFFSFVRAARRTYRDGFSRSVFPALAIAAATLATGGSAIRAQGMDCGQLRAQIARHDRGGNRYAGAARRQASELARTQAYAHQLGCDGAFSFFGGNPQCGGLNARIEQMQANLGQLQAGGGGMRNDLVARFNAYCRGDQPPRQRGFFESLFGGAQDEPRPGPLPGPPPPDRRGPVSDDDEEPTAHRGSQAVCVRTCDGGFFPLGVSARHGGDNLNEMCSALCPGTETAVYTRNPDSEIKTAMSLDGKPYMDMPNALKFTKNVTPACSCRPAGKTWAEALANAEDVIGNQRKGDIMVTPEKSDEMSRPRLDPKTRSSLLQKPATAMVSPEDAAKIAGDAATVPAPQAPADEAPGPDGLKRSVRRVGPQP